MTRDASTSTSTSTSGDPSSEGSSSSGEPVCDEDPFQGIGTELDISVCDPTGTFTLEIDNEFFPLVVGETKIFEGMDELVHLEITVLDEVEEVAGVMTRVVQEHEMIDGETVEISRNYFAQTMDGTVCYFGEAVDIYEGGEIVAHDGAWRADDPDAAPGIQMPPDPMAGTYHAQETVPGVAEDYANIIAVDDEVMAPFGTFDDTVTTSEWSPLEPCHFSDKAYAAGLGLLYDNEIIPLIDVVNE